MQTNSKHPSILLLSVLSLWYIYLLVPRYWFTFRLIRVWKKYQTYWSKFKNCSFLHTPERKEEVREEHLCLNNRESSSPCCCQSLQRRCQRSLRRSSCLPERAAGPQETVPPPKSMRLSTAGACEPLERRYSCGTGADAVARAWDPPEHTSPGSQKPPLPPPLLLEPGSH